MKYIIHSFLKGPIEDYQHNLVDGIYKKFGLNITKKEGLATHFTLKYWFETDNVQEVENVVESFCKNHKKAPVRVGGFGDFSPKTIFINVNLSKEAEEVFPKFIAELKKIQWMSWDKYDAENLHFHSTIAEECNEKFKDVKNFLKGKEKYFDCWFDNITILKLVDGEQNFGKWEVHKTFLME